MDRNLSCIDCGAVNCNSGKKTYPDFCLTTHMEPEILKEVLEKYEDPKNNKIAKASAEVENDYYCMIPRVEEIMKFAEKMEAKKIGIATCVGLIRESRILTNILRIHGFEVYGVACKVGAIPKTDIGIPERCMEVGTSMCNPIMQAELLNREQTDLNIVMGLCVGHDSLFYKYSKALVTTLVCKDRVLGHNPVAALYTAETYYKKLLSKDEI